MQGRRVVLFLIASLGWQPIAAACSVNFIPWQSQAVWPRSEAPLPLNTQLHVRIPLAVAHDLDRAEPPAVTPKLSGQLLSSFVEPVSRLARSLSLQEVAASAGEPVPISWHATVGSQEALFVLVPRTPLRPQTEYAVVMDSPSKHELLAKFHTGRVSDVTPPTWRGIKGARYMPAEDTRPSSCPPLPAHAPFVELAIHEASDEGLVQYAIWAAKAGEALRYQDQPLALLIAHHGALVVYSLPHGGDRVRIGVRAMDAAGNLSPASEVELERPPAGR